MKTICLNQEEDTMIRHKCLLRYKSQLVHWATIRWPDEPVSKFNKMSKKQLYWLWYNKSKYNK